MSRQAPFFVWHWRDRGEIPDADEKFESPPKGEKAYTAELAGRPVVEVLDEIERFLERRDRG